MPTYETTKFLSLPQQVNKNKNDIKTLQDNQADISNLIPKTEKGQPLGVATLDISGKVPSAQLPSNPGNFLPLAGGTMTGDINLNNREITNGNTIAANQIITDEIQSPGGELEVFAPIFMDGNKIKAVAKGTANGDVLTVENMTDHNTSPFAHADIRNLISAIQGAYIYRGVINENTIDVTQINLNARILVLMGRAAILGDVLTDLDRTDWYYDGSSWDNMGQTFVVLASAVNDGLMSKEDYTKLFDLYTKAQIDAKFELLANKAIDWSVLNDTKYPTTKAVAEMLLNLPIAELNNHTLREVFEGGNLLLNSISPYTNTNNWTAFNSSLTIENNMIKITPTQQFGGIRQTVTGLTIGNNIWVTFYLQTTGLTNIELWEQAGVQTLLQKGSNGRYSFDRTLTNATSIRFNTAQPTSTLVIHSIKDIYLINRTPLGISALTVTQMDYWFNVYQALQVSMANGIFTLFAPKQQETWLTPTLTTATTTYLKYRKDNFGTVIVEGNITVTTAGTNLTLPTGYRPLFAYTVGILTFNTDGTVVSSTTGTQTLSVRFTGGA